MTASNKESISPATDSQKKPAEEIVEQKQKHQPQQKNVKKQQPETEKAKSLSFEERKAQREARNLENRLKKAADPNAQVLKSSTDDMYQFLSLLRLSDNLLYQMRMKAGTKIPFDKVAEFYERQKKLKDDLNLLNADISKEMGWDYETPKALQN